MAIITEEVEKVWACRLFSWTEKGEARGIEARWATEPLIIGRYVELKGTISVEKLPLPVIINMKDKIDREQRFLNWVGRGSRESEKEEWMDAYPSLRLSNFLEVEFAVREADFFVDDLIFSIGNVGGGSDLRPSELLFLAKDDTERRRIFDGLSLQQRHERGIIAFRVMTDVNTGDVTGLELSTVWRVSGSGEAISRPEYCFDVGLQCKYEGEGETIGELLDGGVSPRQPTTYRLLGRSPESDAGPIEIECFLAFIYWNPIQNRDMGLPDGIEVRVIDYDPVSVNDVIGRGRITGNEGKVHIITVNKDEDNPDVFFEVLTDGRYIELETNRLVTRDERHPDKHYLLLPQKWSSKDKYAVDYTIGYINDFSGSNIGSVEFPLTFRLSLDCFIQFVYWNEIQQKYVGLPEGIEVEVLDYDPEAHLGIPIIGPLVGLFAADDPLGHNFTSHDGKVYLRLFYKDEVNPDIYFKYKVPDDKPNRIDLRSNKLRGESILEREIQLTAAGPVVVERPIGTKMPRLEDGTLPIPREWSTRQRYTIEDPRRKGYWDNFVGSRIGIVENPYVFDIFQEMPRFIAGNKVDYLINGDQALPRIEQAIENAERSIHIEMMLFYNDEIGNRIKELLIRKAREGVEVRLLFDVDTTASSYNLIMLKKIWIDQLMIMEDARRRRLLDQLDLEIDAERGRGNTTEMRREIEATRNIMFRDSSFPYVQLMPSAPWAVPDAYRDIEGRLPFFTIARIDHRKIIIVDGKIGFLGGMNIGKEYLYNYPFNPNVDAEEEARTADAERWIKWHDCFCEIHGPAVRELQKFFRERWATEGGDEFSTGPHDLGVGTDPNHPYFPRINPEPENVSVKVVSTTPGSRFHIHEEYLNLIDNAREEIYVENPYLSSLEVKEHLIRAAKRGVQVHYVFPDEHNDSFEFVYSGRIKYEDFLNAGVHVYEYRNHMTHAKVATIDHNITVIGSANLNHSSMFNHYECKVFIKSETITGNFKRDLFHRDIANSRQISRADLDELIQIYPAAYLYLWSIVNVWF